MMQGRYRMAYGDAASNEARRQSGSCSAGRPPTQPAAACLLCRLLARGSRRTPPTQVADEGGGIPRSGLPRMFTYLYTTARSPLDDMDDAAVADGPSVLAG
jgi:hypothetical protein